MPLRFILVFVEGDGLKLKEWGVAARSEFLPLEHRTIQRMEHVGIVVDDLAALARRANGWVEWKYKDGRTLDEVKRREDSRRSDEPRPRDLTSP